MLYETILIFGYVPVDLQQHHENLAQYGDVGVEMQDDGRPTFGPQQLPRAHEQQCHLDDSKRTLNATYPRKAQLLINCVANLT